MPESCSTLIEINQRKKININSKLEEFQKNQFIKLPWRHSGAFAWEYIDMWEIYPNVYTHHIYIQEYYWPIKQPQRHMNSTMKEIVKEELQKLLNMNFIYPISNSH